jgi:carbonic anhydrase
MTIPYNISLNGIGEQLEKKIWKLDKYDFIIPGELSVNGKSFSMTNKEFGI